METKNVKALYETVLTNGRFFDDKLFMKLPTTERELIIRHAVNTEGEPNRASENLQDALVPHVIETIKNCLGDLTACDGDDDNEYFLDLISNLILEYRRVTKTDLTMLKIVLNIALDDIKK